MQERRQERNDRKVVPVNWKTEDRGHSRRIGEKHRTRNVTGLLEDRWKDTGQGT